MMKKRLMLSLKKIAVGSHYIMLGILLGIAWFACEKPTAPENSNIPPMTTLTNIPASDDTLYALVTLHWTGGDEDGYIEGYEYRYTTEYLSTGERVTQPWVWTIETSMTIAFNSPDSLNQQTFEVRAVDNDGAADDTAATRTFYTVQTIFPEVELLFPADSSEFFYLDETTDWWGGILLTLTGQDEDGEIVEYGWAVDGGDWIWMEDTTLYLTPDMFTEPLDGYHTIHVTARDNTNLLDVNDNQITIRLVKPTFEKDILVIDETDENSSVFQKASITDAAVDSFYADILASYNSPNPSFSVETWDYAQDGLPSRQILGQYKLILWHADNVVKNPYWHALPKHSDVIRDYLEVGGDFIASGWRLLRSYTYTAMPHEFEWDSFVRNYLHVEKMDETRGRPGDFTGAKGFSFGTNVFHDVEIDTTKLMNAGSPYSTSNGKLSEISIVVIPSPFATPIYTYRGNNQSYIGLSCGIRYYGTSYNTVVIGFPIFFIKKEDARVMIADMLSSLGY